MAGEAAQMVFTDPPYNVPIDGHVCGLGRIRHREFAMASGEMSRGRVHRLPRDRLGHLPGTAPTARIHFVCMDWRHLASCSTAGRAIYRELKNLMRLGQGQWRHGHLLPLPA